MSHINQTENVSSHNVGNADAEYPAEMAEEYCRVVVEKLRRKLSTGDRLAWSHLQKTCYYSEPQEKWIDHNWLIETGKEFCGEYNSFDEEYNCFNAQIFLLQQGEESYKPRLHNFIDEWMAQGGHDLADEVLLLNLISEHPYAQEILEEHEKNPEHFPEVREEISQRLHDEILWMTQKKAVNRPYTSGSSGVGFPSMQYLDPFHWSSCVIDISEDLWTLPAGWVKVLMDDSDQQALYDLMLEITEVPEEQMSILMREIAAILYHCQWPDIAIKIRELPFFPQIFLGLSPFHQRWMQDMGSITTGKSANSHKTGHSIPFAEAYLHWSLLLPDETTRRTLARMVAMMQGRGIEFRDRLAVAISYLRCCDSQSQKKDR